MYIYYIDVCCNTWSGCMDTAGMGQVILQRSYREMECNPNAPLRMGTTTLI